MPEGPSILILKELVQPFTGKLIEAVDGNIELDLERIEGQRVIAFKSWGKHFLVCLETFTVRIHFMLFGSYSINERKKTKPKLVMQFAEGEINFYACSIQFIEENLDAIYDWTGDIMNDKWNAKKARKKMLDQPLTLACDALLDQHIFAGSGNIIKNEVLFRVRAHPESNVGALPKKLLKQLADETREYSFDFFKWKKNGELKKRWEAYSKKICPRCNIPLVIKTTGKTKRRSFFCINCQILYTNDLTSEV